MRERRCFSGISGDAFLETRQAGLRIAKFMSGFETSMASLRCGRYEVALQFRNARTHLPSLVLTQRLDPSTPAHRSSCQQKPCGFIHRDLNFRQVPKAADIGICQGSGLSQSGIELAIETEQSPPGKRDSASHF
ncbi:hypothetical protein [Mesorhizobium sp.]|uniref:hypothetical protein n=1 Tax=Mesorhizobium sp. TaxID=1871066 RepID=UPI00257F992C|nr:hypothetical protein [Mesorhizobium sp.]